MELFMFIVAKDAFGRRGQTMEDIGALTLNGGKRGTDLALYWSWNTNSTTF